MNVDDGEEGVYRVVLVEDNDALRELTRATLEKLGPFEVVGEARDGTGVGDLVADADPDLLLLDLAMPDRDGFEAMEDLREEAPSVPIAVLSGFARDVAGEAALDHGADLYIEKGLAGEELVARLRDLVEGRTSGRSG